MNILTLLLIGVGGYLIYSQIIAPSGPTLTGPQIVQAASRVFNSAANPRAGITAVRAQAGAVGVGWDQVVSAFRSAGGTTWAAFQNALVAAGEPRPQ